MGKFISTRDRRQHVHHPWRAWSLLPDWKLEWTDDLPFGVWGHTIHAEKRVLLANGMDEAQRRCTAEHERHHALRGPVERVMTMREELVVDRIAARTLMPDIQLIGRALAWHRAAIEPAADELWVDEVMLHVRLSSLDLEERRWLDEQLATILVADL
jgi:hypothetical protein